VEEASGCLFAVIAMSSQIHVDIMEVVVEVVADVRV
jgi:hypothetical protein